MRKSTVNRKTAYLLGVILFIGLWSVVSLLNGKDTMIFPAPWKVIIKTIELLTSSYTWRCIYESFARCMTGFSLAFILSIILGVISGVSPAFDELLRPTVTALKTVPTASLVFLFIVLSGARSAPVYIVCVISFPILYEGVKGGIRNVDQSVLEAARVDGAGTIDEIRDIRLPLALPYIAVALASSLSLSFKIEIMSEVITGTTYPGLGSAIATIRRLEPADMVPVFGYSLIAVVIFLLFDYISSAVSSRNRS